MAQLALQWETSLAMHAERPRTITFPTRPFPLPTLSLNDKADEPCPDSGGSPEKKTASSPITFPDASGESDSNPEPFPGADVPEFRTPPRKKPPVVDPFSLGDSFGDVPGLNEGLTRPAVAPPVQTNGSLTREQRAHQVAVELASELGWGRAGAGLLLDLFLQYGWSSPAAWIREQASLGLTVDSLRATADLRNLWEQHPEFHSAARYGLEILDWSTAWILAESFAGYPDSDELETVLLAHYENWCSRRSRGHSSPSFYRWVRARAGREIEMTPALEWGMDRSWEEREWSDEPASEPLRTRLREWGLD